MARSKAQKIRGEVQADLLSQLENRGANTAVFRQQVEDYLFLYDALADLKADVKKRGALVQEPQGKAGNLVWQPNPAVREAANVNQQMQRLLKDLGLSLRPPGNRAGAKPQEYTDQGEEDEEII